MAGKFHFRLETLLRLRKSREDQCGVELAEACRDDEELGRQIEGLNKEQEHLREESRKVAGPGEIHIDQLLQAHRYARSLLTQQAQLCRERETATREIERRRESLLAAKRKVQVLEKLRDRRQAQHRVEEGRRSAKELDEAAMRRVGR
jgi:flagellar protein FliJ